MSKDYTLKELESLSKQNWKKMTPIVLWHLPISFVVFIGYVHTDFDVKGVYNPWPAYLVLLLAVLLSLIVFFRKKPVLIVKYPISFLEYVKVYLLKISCAVFFGLAAVLAAWANLGRSSEKFESINLLDKAYCYFKLYLIFPMWFYLILMVFFFTTPSMLTRK